MLTFLRPMLSSVGEFAISSGYFLYKILIELVYVGVVGWCDGAG